MLLRPLENENICSDVSRLWELFVKFAEANQVVVQVFIEWPEDVFIVSMKGNDVLPILQDKLRNFLCPNRNSRDINQI